MKWDIDWKKLGHPEPGIMKTTFPQAGLGTEIKAAPQARPSTEVKDKTPEPAHQPQTKVVKFRDPQNNQAGNNTAPKTQTPPDTKPRVVNIAVPQPPENIDPPNNRHDEHIEHDEQNDNNNAPAEPQNTQQNHQPSPQRQYNNIRNRSSNSEDSKMITSKQEKMSDTAVGFSATAPEYKSRARNNEQKVEKLRSDSREAAGRRRGRDLGSGMELLELDFLLGVIEDTASEEVKDVDMRKMSFREVLRRQQLQEIDSTALKDYAVNDRELYDKQIQHEAMKELFERTVSGSGK